MFFYKIYHLLFYLKGRESEKDRKRFAKDRPAWSQEPGTQSRSSIWQGSNSSSQSSLLPRKRTDRKPKLENKDSSKALWSEVGASEAVPTLAPDICWKKCQFLPNMVKAMTTETVPWIFLFYQEKILNFMSEFRMTYKSIHVCLFVCLF